MKADYIGLGKVNFKRVVCQDHDVHTNISLRQQIARDQNPAYIDSPITLPFAPCFIVIDRNKNTDAGLVIKLNIRCEYLATVQYFVRYFDRDALTDIKSKRRRALGIANPYASKTN